MGCPRLFPGLPPFSGKNTIKFSHRFSHRARIQPMFSADRQDYFHGRSRRRARSRDERFALRGSLRSRLSGIERLEGRWLLSVAPLPAPPEDSHVAVFQAAPAPPTVIVDSGRHDRTLAVMEVGDDQFAPPPPVAGDPAAPQILDSPAFRLAPLGGVLPLTAVGSPPTTTRAIPAVFAQAGNLDGDSSVRFADVAPDFEPLIGFATMLVQDDLASDPHLRLFETARESRFDASQPAILPDSARVSPSGGSHDDAILESQRQATPGSATTPGQNAETEATFGAGPMTSHLHREELPTEAAPSRETVSHLVAFNRSDLDGPTGETAPNGRPSGGNWTAAASVLNDLLVPRFAGDAASLGVALTDLLAEADELGDGLLGLLTGPPVTCEAALVAGLVGAGVAYRHWRGGQRREENEAREVLWATFVSGPASLRIHRSAS